MCPAGKGKNVRQSSNFCNTTVLRTSQLNEGTPQQTVLREIDQNSFFCPDDTDCVQMSRTDIEADETNELNEFIRN